MFDIPNTMNGLVVKTYWIPHGNMENPPASTNECVTIYPKQYLGYVKDWAADLPALYNANVVWQIFRAKVVTDAHPYALASSVVKIVKMV